jgi:RNA polymerase sigma-70 factor, ECF subfamily
MGTPRKKTSAISTPQMQLSSAHRDFVKGLNDRAYFKTHDHAMSDDLVQVTFLKTWKYLLRGGKIDTMRAFLHHILNDLIIDEYRKKKVLSLDALIEQGFDPGMCDLDHIINTLDGKTAVKLLESLPPKYQLILRLRFVEDLTIAEISTKTHQSKNAVTVQIHRGLAKLKLLYQVKILTAAKSLDSK